jgi:hypothetical protein
LSCGQIIGFNDFEKPDTGRAERIEVFLTETNLIRFYNTVSSFSAFPFPEEEDDVPCRISLGGGTYNGFIWVRGDTSRRSPKKNIALKYFDTGKEKKYALMSEAGTWMQNRIAMYAYKNYKGYADAGFSAEGLSATPETNASALFINGEYLGYYAKVDMYSKEGLEKVYRNKIAGQKTDIPELFKVHLTSYNEYPLYSRSEKKFPDNKDFSSLEILINNVTTMQGSEWENWVNKNIDIYDFIRYLVVHDYFGVRDTIWHNFYIYNYGKITILPWDNDKCATEISEDNFYGHNELTKKFLEIPYIRDLYKTELNNFINDAAFNAELKAKINDFYEEAKEAVKDDPIFYYNFDDFKYMKNLIINFLENRKNYIQLKIYE